MSWLAGAPEDAGGDAIWVLNAEVEQPVGIDLQNLDLKQHFRVGDVIGRHQAFDRRDDVQVVAHHHHLESVVHIHRLRRNQCLDHLLHPLGIRVLQIERAHDQVFVALLLFLGVGVDQQGRFVEDLLAQLTGSQHQVQCILHRCVLREDRGLDVGLEVLVQDEVDIGRAGEDFQHSLDADIAQFKRHRLFQCLRQHGIGSQATVAFQLDPLKQPLRLRLR
ncbi:hypothetical protein FQZ97_854430 [compost metagenome]